MSKRKGVSADEKRNRMLELFYEKKDFFLLKDLEKIAPKEKGIIAQAVKDVVKGLVDDNLVDSEKIGTSVYFWAFPSKAKHLKKKRLADLKNSLEEANKKLKTSKEKVLAAKVGREDTEKRQKLLQRLNALKVDEERVSLEIQKFGDSDPEVLEQMKKEMQIAKESANRWTDNIDIVKTWCKRNHNHEEEQLNKQFGIPPELDYLD